jgi:hypothetical protein
MSMKSRSLVFLLANALIFALMLWGAGCSESTSPEEGVDTSPPVLESVSPIDMYHIEVAFNEELDGATAEDRYNYLIYSYGVTASGELPLLENAAQVGDTLSIGSAVLVEDESKVLISLMSPMEGWYLYILKVEDIEDLNGNAMTEPDSLDFVGTDGEDITPPVIIRRSPLSGATGVGIGESVVVTFSEPMLMNSVVNAFRLSRPGGDITCDWREMEANIFSFTPLEPLENGVLHTVEFSGGVARDYSDNSLDAVSWFFTTTGMVDNTPPAVVSTTPADGATGVPLGITLQIRFSEPIDSYSLGEGILITPETGDGVLTWSDGGRVLNFDPYEPLLENTMYSLIIAEGAVRDYAGNPLSGVYWVKFTTGAAFPTGGFGGTISGDPNSIAAADPEGAMVIAFMTNIFEGGGGDGSPPIGGIGVVGENGDYEVGFLEDGTYWPVAWMDTDGDGRLQPEYGDVIGVYGVDFGSLEGEPGSVEVSGGSVETGIDFPLYDPIAIWGRVTYGGTEYSATLQDYKYSVGIFDTSTYDPENLTPEYGTEPNNIYGEPYFNVNEFEDGLVDGSYYIGAYLDVNGNENYDPDIDPAGFYEVDGEMTCVTVENGQDSGDGIVIVLRDPETPGLRGVSKGVWLKPAISEGAVRPALREAIDRIKRALEERSE